MYKVIVIGDDGYRSETENVLDYNLIDVGLVQYIAKNDFETELTKDEIKEVEDRLKGWEELPDTYHLKDIVCDVIEDRE